MFSYSSCPVFLTSFIRKLRGGSQPILAEASDGQCYVVKFTNNLQGLNLPFNESMGTELYRACGLPIAPWKPLLVSDDFLDQNPACWMQTPEGTLRPNSGMCFGSRFLGGEGIRLYEILPGNLFKRVQNLKDFWLTWLVDICAGHSDNRQSLFRESCSGELNAVFIDHGHMFGGPNGNQKPHSRASRYLDARVYEGTSANITMTIQGLADNLNTDRLWELSQALPDEWAVNSARANFASCLDRLSNSRLLQNIVESIMDSYHQANACDQFFSNNERNSSVSILHPGVQGARRLGNNVA